MSRHRKPSVRPRLILTALALAAGASLFVVGQSTASGDGTIPTPVATASPNSVVVCDPASISPDGSFSLPCFGPALPTPETTTVTVTTPVPTTVTQTVTVTPSPTLTTVTPTVTPTPPPTTTPPPAAGFPNAANTGVPAGVTLQPYTRSCSITAANTTIVGQLVNCDLTINAPNVAITNTRINGKVAIGSAGTLVMTDSEVHATPGAIRQVTGVESHDYTLTRVEITGGNRGAYCAIRCLIQDSWIHGQKIKDAWHASGVRMEQQTTLLRNTIVCDAPVQPNPEGSCSASLTGYGDFAPVRDNLIQGNWFPPTVYSAFCAYGGSSGASTPTRPESKPYADEAANVRFIGNTFGKGTTANNRWCGLYGAIADFSKTAPGNLWQANVWSDGTPVTV